MLDRKKAAGAAKTRLHFVSDEKRAVFPAEPHRFLEIEVAGDIDRLSLDRLQDEGRDTARGEHFFKRCEIVESDFVCVGKQRSEAVAKVVLASHRERAIGEAVKAVCAVDEPRAARRSPGELDGGLYRF